MIFLSLDNKRKRQPSTGGDGNGHGVNWQDEQERKYSKGGTQSEFDWWLWVRNERPVCPGKHFQGIQIVQGTQGRAHALG